MNERLNDLFRSIRECRKCERCLTRHLAVPGAGSPRAEVFMVGEAPGRKEDEVGEPFVGRAGKYLARVLEQMHVSRSDLYITSILKCYHPQAPKLHQVTACIPWTEQQVEVVAPRVILIMGLTAAKAVLGVNRLKDEPSEPEWHGIRCIVACHPASAMRFPGRDGQFRRGLRRALDYRQG